VSAGAPVRAPRERAGFRAPTLDGIVVCAAFAAALAMFALTERRIAGPVALSSFPLDDSWIHLHFARNLAEGYGFAYNPGVPVAGSTAPLWTIVLAGAFVLFGSEPVWAKAIGVAATVATALMTRRLAWEWTQSRGLALLAGVLTALAGPLVWGALSGMEVSLAALLVAAALVRHAAADDWGTAVLLGLGTLARPEAVLLAPLVWLAGPLTVKRTAILSGVVGACLAPWVLFNLATAGTPLPATAAAKIKGGLIGVLLSGRREPITTALFLRPLEFQVEWFRWLASMNVLLPALTVAGIWALWRRLGWRAALPAAILVLHPLGMALLAPFQAPSFQEGRYSIHLVPIAMAAGAAGLGLIARGRPLRVGIAMVLLVASLVALGPAARRHAWAVQNIESMQVRLGHWVVAHTPPDARLALNDVGAIAYVSRREVVDLIGLVTPAIIPYRREGETGVLRYLEQVCPDYLIIFPTWFPALAEMRDLFTPIHRIRLEHNTVAGGDEMVVYETPWNRWHGQQPCGDPARPSSPRGRSLRVQDAPSPSVVDVGGRPVRP